MKTLILTVPHSGTHFLLKYLVAVLGLHGGDTGGITPKSNVDFAHAHPSSTKEIPEGVYDSVIITLRHPHKSSTTGKLGGANIVQLADSWKALIDRFTEYDKKLILVIDGPKNDRYPQLMAIANHFGKSHLREAIKKYADDWSPVNQSLSKAEKDAMNFATAMYKKWQS